MRGVQHAGRHLGRALFQALAELGTVRMSPPRGPEAAAARLAAALAAIARAHDLEVRVHGDVPSGRVLLVANHVSYLDPVAILPVCPAIPIAKGDVAAWPIIGPIARGLGVVFVERERPVRRARALRRVHDLLAAGAPVLNFPEGTTTPGVQVAPFWRGTFGVAQRLDVPVVPVAVRYRDPELAWCGRELFLPHYWRTVCRARLEVALRFGPAMHPRTGEAPEAMAARARGIIARMLETTRWIDAGPSVCVSSPRPDPVLPATGVA